MTKQEFLSASLPYGLKCLFGEEIFDIMGVGLLGGSHIVALKPFMSNATGIKIEECKPIIRSLSDLTKECIQADYNDGKPFVPIKIMLNEITESWAKVGLNYPNDETGLYKDIVSNINSCEYWIIKLLLNWHFDLITEYCEKVYVTDEFNPYK